MRLRSRFAGIPNTIKSRMLLIIFFLSVISTALGCLITVVYLNVVIRRESAYVIEERIEAVVDYPWNPRVVRDSASPPRGSPDVSRREGLQNAASASPNGLESVQADATQLPPWLAGRGFRGLVLDRGVLTVRWVVDSSRAAGAKPVSVIDRPIDKAFLSASGIAAGVAMMDVRIEPLATYRGSEGLIGEVVANFVPGSGRPVPVIVTARDWVTGRPEDLVVCRIRLNYRHTLRDLGRMGIRRASWLLPLLILTSALAIVYVVLASFCIYLGRGIVTAVNALSAATQRVGQGDLSVQVAIVGDDQLGKLGEAFNAMTRNLASVQRKDHEAILLKADLDLASEVQAYLTPTQPTLLKDATVWSTSTPARRVSGDLHETFVFSETKVGLICADVSGKGISSALVMAHLQGLLHAYLRDADKRVSPADLAKLLNAELCRRLPVSRYATFFYAEADLGTRTLTYVNAGHSSPLVVDQGGTYLVRDGDMPIGLFAEATFVNHTLPLNPGSALVVYTDGVTEALNKHEEQFGEQRLLSFCNSFSDHRDAATLGQALRQEIVEWSSGVEVFDDASVLVLSLG